MWALRIAITLMCFTLYSITSSPMEDKLETEINPSLPKTFKAYETLSVRQVGFKTAQVYNGNTQQYWTMNIGNWELFAMKYWYETRQINMTCPQTPQGIAAACDWALMVPCLFGDVTKEPRTIFVHSYMLPHFVESTFSFLPNKSWSFVLVSAGSDMTIPQSNRDVRFKGMRGFGGGGGKYFQALVNSPQIIHWYAENKDMDHPKFSALPGGYDPENPDARPDFPNTSIPLQMRPLLVMSADRVRTRTGQWADRAAVEILCKNVTYCTQPFQGVYAANEGGVTHRAYLEHLAGVPFIACVHGGGVDPSPKAWEAILIGTIPIIQRLTIADAYEHLPVAFVDQWTDLFHNPDAEDMLKGWLDRLAPYYEEGSALRKQTLERLKTSYWKEKFNHKIHEHDALLQMQLQEKSHP